MTLLIAFTRFLHLGSATLLLGVFAFMLIVARPAFQKADNTEGEKFARFDRLLLSITTWTLLIAVATAILWLAIQSAEMSGRDFWQALAPGIIWTVLTRTQFGHVWQLRLGLSVLLGFYLLFRERGRDAKDWIALRMEGAFIAGSTIAALAWA
ncbi:MAG TPA: hypothetical protein VN203_04515, partial [Candidatus Acidoferrum sp.]|nr:hypothetical protein [Candidatus Acidoferrum sp.]